MNSSNESATYTATANGALKRIRTPNPNDVLSGRGGGINGHAGNVQFREWVRVRKNDYNLAPNKNEKARVAKEVIDLIRAQNPPGRFLQKDPTAMGAMGWWIELDEERIMAKTAQALREGAPQIREEHKDEFEENKVRLKRRQEKLKSPAPSPAAPVPVEAFDKHKAWKNMMAKQTQEMAMEEAIEELRANVEAAKHGMPVSPATSPYGERPIKRVRVDYNGHFVLPTDETPPLLPLTSPDHLDFELPLLPPPAAVEQVFPAPPRREPATVPRAPAGDKLIRTHSLAFSDMSNGDWPTDEFVNPFEDESDSDARRDSSPRLGTLTRETSVGSHGDMGGIGALFNNNDSFRSSSGSSGVRSRNSIGNLSSRYEDEDDWAEPLLVWETNLRQTSDFWWHSVAPVSP